MLTSIIGLSLLCAEEVEIKLQKEKLNDSRDYRSLVYLPTVVQDANTFYITSEVPLENTQVCVTDWEGNLVYSNIITLSGGQSYSFTIDELEVGAYMFELNTEKEEYYGTFEVEKNFH